MASTNPRTYESTPSRKVAFLGLGVMGFPMAGHLALAGHRVTVFNRSAEKRVAWCKEFTGGAAPTPREAVADCDFVFCCVGNDDDLRSVVLGDQGAFAGTAHSMLASAAAWGSQTSRSKPQPWMKSSAGPVPSSQ